MEMRGVCLCDLISFEMFTGSVARTSERSDGRANGRAVIRYTGGRVNSSKVKNTDFQLDRNGSVSISSWI